MPLTHPFDPPRPLHDVFVRLSELPPYAWLYIPSSVTNITLDTPCQATTFDSWDLSPHEQQQLDSLAGAAQMRCFLSRHQLEDIRINLESQRPDHSAAELAAAADYYWRHDAFIDLSKIVG